MTPADRLRRACDEVLRLSEGAINSVPGRDVHEYVIRVKPRGDAMRVSVVVETAEREV